MRAANAAALAGLVIAAGAPVMPLTDSERRAAAGDASAATRPGIPLDHEEQPYGHLYVKGSPTTQEVFRANFGGLIPCGSRQVAWMPDKVGCAPVTTPIVSSRFALALRGNCTFTTKAAYAQKAGAHGLIVINTEPGLLRMPLGTRPINEDNALYLPAFMVREQFASVAARFDAAGETMTAALRPFRGACIPDAEYEPHKAIKASISPSSPALIAKGVKSPFVVEPPPGDSDWAPARASGGLAVVEAVSGAAAQADAASNDGSGVDVAKGAMLEAEFALAAFGGPPVSALQPLVLAEPADACRPLSKDVNATGSVLVVRRGVCPMIDKARAAQAANATAVLIINNDETASLLAALDAVAGPHATDGIPPLDRVTEEAAALVRQGAPSFDRVGVVQAAPDSDPESVHIAAVMVSAEDGERIWGLARAGATVRLGQAGAVPVGESWEAVREVGRLRAAFWPEGERDADEAMVRLLRMADPRAAGGSSDRLRALVAMTLLSGADRARRLVELREELGFDNRGNPLPHAVDEPVVPPVPVLSSAEPATAFLLDRMPASAMRLRNADNLGCSIEGGIAHVRVSTPRLEKGVGLSVAPRVGELLRYQACVEKLLLHNSAALGRMLALLRSETQPDVFSSHVHGLLRRYGSPDAATSLRMASAYERAAGAIGREPRPLGNTTSAAPGTVGAQLRNE